MHTHHPGLCTIETIRAFCPDAVIVHSIADHAIANQTTMLATMTATQKEEFKKKGLENHAHDIIFVGCDAHALNLALSVPIETCFGKGEIGQCSLTQAIYTAW